jgi:alkylation response protein AidB-like acyl-CoA dehydrogenase
MPSLGMLDDAAAFAGEVRGWLQEHSTELEPFRHEPSESIEARQQRERAFHRALHDAGLLRRGWPVEHGGLGGTPLLRAVLHEEISAAGYVLPEAFIGLEVIAPMLVEYAPHLASAYLPPKLRGDEEWCQGFSEPDAGSDLASLRTRAQPDGDGWRVSGQKIWSSNGQVSRWCALLARTGTVEERHRGLSMLWVDLHAAGVETRPIASASGRNETAEIFLDDVFVPADHVVGDVGRGWDVVMYLMQFERGMFAWGRQAMLHGQLQEALADASRGPTELAAAGDAYLALCALRERALETVVRLSAGERLGPETSVTKILLTMGEQAVYDAVRVLRGPSFELADDTAAAVARQHWFFSRIVGIYGGAGEVQRDLVARHLLGLPRSA